MQSKVQCHQIYEVVMERIKDDIASGRLKVGDRLESVRDLAHKLGVGQSSVREAVRVLSYMGLLRVKHGGGTFVVGQIHSGRNTEESAPPILNEGAHTSLRHLIELRLVVEPAAARLAAELASAAECEDIQLRCKEVQDILIYRTREFQEEDIAFHMAIARAGHNPLLLDALERVHTQLHLSRQITSHVPQLLHSALHFHPQIMQSILSRNAQRAENFMRAHLEDVLWWLEVYDAQHQAHPGELESSESSRRQAEASFYEEPGKIVVKTIHLDSVLNSNSERSKDRAL